MTIEQDRILAVEQALLGIKRAGDGLVVLPGLVKIGSLLEVNGIVRADDPVDETDLVTKGYGEMNYATKVRSMTYITTTYTVAEKDDVIVGAGSNATYPVNLPAATGSGRQLTFIYNAIGAMVVTPNGADTINGAANYTLVLGETLNIVNSIAGVGDITAEKLVHYPPDSHTHDDRYFIDSESDNRFAPITHSHDDLYYTKAQSDVNYAAALHTHSHTALTDIGTNTHAQIDTFIGSKAAASGLASLNASSLVVQNPANATATPTASKIPIADANGKLDGWINDASTTVKGKVELATDGETAAGVVVQGNDGRLSNARTPTAHNLLSDSHGDTLADTVVAGDIIIGNATPKFARLAKGTRGHRLVVGATLPEWQAETGWIDAGAMTWTYASASTFTVAGDQRAIFQKGTLLKFDQTTTKYAVVGSSSYSSPNTTVNIIVNTDYTIASAAITNPYYSYAANPQGWPGWFAWSPTLTGYSADPTNAV